MAKLSVLDIMKTRMTTPLEFHYDSLQIPPIERFLSLNDVKEMNFIATSIRLSSNIKLKYKMIDDIMKPRGFKRFSAGTNRVVYSFLEDTSFVVKIAVDRVGMQDNPAELQNQHYIKPYVSKMFYTSYCGTIGFVERVLPVKNKEEFRQIAPDVFDILVNNVLGRFVVEDIGTRYFMNYGVRSGFGPVLIDYPYVYPLDGKKLFCTNILPMTGMICDGEIDYDEGFNNLVCTRCGKKYLACELRDKSSDNKSINIKGGNKMKVSVMLGDKIVRESLPADEVMRRRKNQADLQKPASLKVSMVRGDEVIATSAEVKEQKVVIETAPTIKKMNVSIANGDSKIHVEEPKKAEPVEFSTTSTTDKEVEVEEENTIDTEVEVETDTEDDEEYEAVDQFNLELVGDLYSSRSSDYEEDEEEDDEPQDTAPESKYEEYDEQYNNDNVRNRKVITKGFKNKNSKFMSHNDNY